MAGEINPRRRRGEHAPAPTRRTIAGRRAVDLYGMAGEFGAAALLLSLPVALIARTAYELAQIGWAMWPG